jgi:pimeloyl-ACP methyl ester carboxylesterase
VSKLPRRARPEEEGSGDPLVFLHGISGPDWNAVLEELSQTHRVIAPRHPGFGDESQTELDDLSDLVYVYLDLLDALDLHDVPLVGHSLGGMIAAELAATQPSRFSQLVLLAPMGLWDAERPVFDFFACTPKEMAAAFFVEPDGAAAQSAGEAGLTRLAQMEIGTNEHNSLVEIHLERAKTLATAAKYLWPIPNRRLDKRIHRIKAPTRLIWGSQDHVVPTSYADDFANAISGAEIRTIETAGHELMLEQPQSVTAAIEEFIG